MLTAQQWEPPALNPGCREQLHPTAPTASALLRQEPHFLLPCVFFFPPSFKAPFKKLQFFFDIVLISVINSFGAKPSFVPTDSLSFTHRQGEGTASTQPSSPCLVLNFAGRSDCWRAPSVTKGHQGWGAAAWAPTASPYSSQTRLRDSRQGGLLQICSTSCKSQHCQSNPLQYQLLHRAAARSLIAQVWIRSWHTASTASLHAITRPDNQIDCGCCAVAAALLKWTGCGHWASAAVVVQQTQRAEVSTVLHILNVLFCLLRRISCLQQVHHLPTPVQVVL